MRKLLIPATRAMLQAAGVPYTIENVEGAPLEGGNLILLCGTMFGLRTPDGAAELRRHRLFETSFSIPLWPRCNHGECGTLSVVGTGLEANTKRNERRLRAISVCGHGAPRVWDRSRPRAISVTGNTPQTNTVRNRERETFSIHDARAAMGIDWMPMKYLSQAIPPAYSQFIGEQFLAWRAARKRAA